MMNGSEELSALPFSKTRFVPVNADKDEEIKKATDEAPRVTFLCIGQQAGTYIGVTQPPHSRLISFRHLVLLRSDESRSARENPAWANLVPGRTASAIFHDDTPIHDTLRLEVPDESVVDELFRDVWLRSNDSRLLFGYEGKVFLPQNARQPKLEWEIKRATSVTISYVPYEASWKGLQTRVQFRVHGREFDLPLTSSSPEIDNVDPEQRWIVTVGLTPPGGYGRVKIAAGVMAIPLRLNSVLT